MDNFNTIIIGFGKAGKTIAVKLSGKGEKVALIEQEPKMYGGTCINVGCIPSKRLVAESAQAPKEDFNKQKDYYEKVILGKRELTEALRLANYKKLISSGVKVIDGLASFLDANTVEVTDSRGNKSSYKAEKIIINTGSLPQVPPIEGLKDNPRVYVSESMLDLTVLPQKLTIIGGGYIGLEFASMYANFGSKVSIIQDGDVFLPREDLDIAESIKAVLEKKGVSIITGAVINRIDLGNLYYSKGGESKVLESDAILVATGRKANTESLNAEKAGIGLTERKAIITDQFLRTNVKNIWAAGDVCGNLQFTYISLDDSRIILSDIEGIGNRTTQNRGAFSYSVFIDPPFSKVGLGEKEAESKKLNYRVVKMNTDAIPKAKVLKKTEGILKAIIDKDSGQILGAALFCPESHEIINMIKMAMDAKLDYKVLRDFIYTHPTISEGLNDLFAL